MRGMNRETGKEISGIDHLRQSIEDILTTPVGTRVMRRDYGSRIFTLTDRPMNRAWLARLYAATAEAIDRWEPRIKVKRVRLMSADQGHVSLEIEGTYMPDGKPVKLEGIKV